MSTVINLSCNSAQETNVAGDISFDAHNSRRCFTHPNSRLQVFESRSEALRGLVVRIRIEKQFGKRLRAASLTACPGDAEGLCSRIDQLGAVAAALFEFGNILLYSVVGVEEEFE